MRVALKGTTVPTVTLVTAGETLIETGTAAVTVSVVESVKPCQVAWMDVVPAARVRAWPRVPPAEEIAAAVRTHLDAGANHVALQAVGEPGVPREGWTALAEVMTASRI